MKSHATKLATAAVILLAVVLSITVLDRMATPAWAWEQTIEAMKNIQAVYLAGRMNSDGSETEFEMWAQLHSDDSTRSGDFRYREGDDHLCVASEQDNVTYVYTAKDFGPSVVYITEGLNRGTYTFPSGDLLAEFRALAQDWNEEHRTDPETGKQSVHVTFVGPPVNTARYWTLQVDPETKLLVKAAVWFDADRQGAPHYEYTEMEYDPQIPAGSFDFDIPGDAQVVDCRKLRQVLADTDDCGVSVGQSDAEAACKIVAKNYWAAVIAKDWDRVQKLRPLADLSTLQNTYQGNQPTELVSIPWMNHLDDPGTFAEVCCTVKTSDGQSYTSVLNVEIAESVGVVAGVIGAELDEAP